MNRARIAPSDCECVQRIAAICGESPMWSVREQALYWTDNLGGVIHRLEPESGSDKNFLLGQNVMGIGLRERGGLVVALAKQLAFYEPGGELELLEGVEHDQPRNRFNDGKVDRQGRLWAGTMNDVDWDAPSGSLYRIDPSLEISRLQAAVACANGLGWSPDGRTFYFGESFRYAIFAYDFDPDDGALSARRVFATVDRSSGAFPDGLTVDVDGGVWSNTNLDVAPASRLTQVLCLNPIASLDIALASPFGMLRAIAGSTAGLETLALRSRGASVRMLGPEHEVARLMGPDLMDSRLREEVLAGGYAQGLEVGGG